MKLVSAALLAVLLPAVAAAQNTGVYIQAGPLADVLFTASADYPTVLGQLSAASPTYRWIDLNGDRRWQPGEETSLVSSSLSFGLPSFGRSRSRVAPGASAALGVFITPSISLRVEGSYQGEHATSTDSDDLGQLIAIEDRQSTSTTDVFVAAGWHQGESQRTTITYLGGMVFRRQRDESTLRYSISDRMLPQMTGLGGSVVGSLSLLDQEFVSTSYSAGIMAGVDVAVSLSEHFAVVPQVRMVAANRALSVRPAVAMRWRP